MQQNKLKVSDTFSQPSAKNTVQSTCIPLTNKIKHIKASLHFPFAVFSHIRSVISDMQLKCEA